MAGDWIKMQHSLPEKPEVLKMAKILSIEPEQVIGHLHRVWSWADQQSLDGHALDVTEMDVDRVARHADVARAMREVGWLMGLEGSLSFPNFDRHNGETAKKRALAAGRKRKERSRTERDNSVTREEKRREEVTPIAPSGQFLRFWGAWPKSERKVSQGKCWSVWLKADFDLQAEAILSHVESLKASPDWKKGFVPLPLTYLNQKRWEGAEAVEPRHEHGAPGRLAV